MVLQLPKVKPGRDKVNGKKILTGIWRKRQIDYVENEIVIKLSTDKTKEKAILEKLQASELKGAKIIRPFDRFGVGMFHIDGDVLKICESLKRHPEVTFAEPNIVDRAAVTVPNDTEYASRQWALPLIGMPEAWDIEQGSPGVMIAIVDSGIPMQGSPLALSHPDLNDMGRIILGNDLVSNTATPRDDFGHGTHVAGIASAQSNNATGIAGVSWNSLLYIVKVFDSNGNGTSQRFHDAVIEAVDYAQTHGLRLVINYSGGGAQAALKEQAVIYARNHQAVVVAAAGNDYAGNVIFPAAYSASYDNVLAVSATDSADAIANYSNIGPEINVAAPGTHIYSCMPNYNVTMNSQGISQNYDYLDGTSMATPHVSGLAALLLSYDNTLGADQVRHTIESNAVDLGTPGWDQSFGYGRIDAHAALDSIVPVVVCPIKTEIGCFFIAEACAKKEFCLYIVEHRPCNFKIEAMPCLVRTEVAGPCVFVREGFCTREICMREMPGMGCMKEGVSQPWGDIVIRKGDPTGEPLIIKRGLKHIKPLTKQAPLSHKKFK